MKTSILKPPPIFVVGLNKYRGLGVVSCHQFLRVGRGVVSCHQFLRVVLDVLGFPDPFSGLQEPPKYLKIGGY